MTEREKTAGSKRSPGTEADIIFIHGYWLSEKGKKTGLSLRSHINTRAGFIDWNHGRGAKKIGVDLGHIWGPHEPTAGSLMAQQLEKYGVPHEAIELKETASTTGGEVKSFVETARANGWKRIVDVAFSRHNWTIPNVYEKFGLRPRYKTAEQILMEKDVHRFNRTYKRRQVLNVDANGKETPWKQVPIQDRQYIEFDQRPHRVSHGHNHTRHLMERLAHSKYEIRYTLYEGVKRWIMPHIPGSSYEKTEQNTKAKRQGKGHFAPMIFRFDRYKVNGKWS